MNNRLEYKNYRGCKDIITIDLHNNYTVIAIKSWNPDEHKYEVQLMLKENTVDKWDLIEKAESLEFNANYKTINSVILNRQFSANSIPDRSIPNEKLETDLTEFTNPEILTIWNTIFNK